MAKNGLRTSYGLHSLLLYSLLGMLLLCALCACAGQTAADSAAGAAGQPPVISRATELASGDSGLAGAVSRASDDSVLAGTTSPAADDSIIAGAARLVAGDSGQPNMQSATARRAGVKFPDEQYQRSTDCFAIETHTPYLGIETIDAQIRNWEDGLRESAIREFTASCASGVRNNRLDLGYETSATFGRVLSVLLLPSIYTGGAHPITNVASFNFDTHSGKSLEYEDIFNDTTGLYEYLSDYAYRAMRPALGGFWENAAYFASGLNPAPENFKYFILTPEGLVLIFPHYQIAPYSAGIQSCLVPLPELLRFQPRPGFWQ